MKKLFLATLALALCASALAMAYPGASVIVNDGCTVVDANGAWFFDAECRLQIVENANGYLVNAHGQLPEGAALPDKAMRRSITDMGFSWCFTPGDRGETVLTPSGNFNVSCHPAK